MARRHNAFCAMLIASESSMSTDRTQVLEVSDRRPLKLATGMRYVKRGSWIRNGKVLVLPDIRESLQVPHTSEAFSNLALANFLLFRQTVTRRRDGHLIFVGKVEGNRFCNVAGNMMSALPTHYLPKKTSACPLASVTFVLVTFRSLHCVAAGCLYPHQPQLQRG